MRHERRTAKRTASCRYDGSTAWAPPVQTETVTQECLALRRGPASRLASGTSNDQAVAAHS